MINAKRRFVKKSPTVFPARLRKSGICAIIDEIRKFLSAAFPPILAKGDRNGNDTVDCKSRRRKLRARGALMDIVEVYSAAGLDLNLKLTQKRGHARELARGAKKEQYERVVCVGGDGTLNEVITGLIESGENIPLGYISLGSTNDFAASMNLSRDVVQAARATLEGTPCPLDVGDFGGLRNFSYVASFGLFTAASYSAPQATKNVLGHLAYILEGIKDIVNIKSFHMRVEAGDECYEDDYMFGAVANSTSIGGIVRLDKDIVDMSDGLFEIMLIKKIRTPAEIEHGPGVHHEFRLQ